MSAMYSVLSSPPLGVGVRREVRGRAQFKQAPPTRRVRRRNLLGGLIHEYQAAA